MRTADALGYDLDTLRQVAAAALQVAYPGIEFRRGDGWWEVRLPMDGGRWAQAGGATLQAAIDAALVARGGAAVAR